MAPQYVKPYVKTNKNDARILMMAAKIKYAHEEFILAAKYTNGVLRVMDQMSGTNAVALAMYTASDYPNIENAVSRTYDSYVSDSHSGSLVVGPNNWTNTDAVCLILLLNGRRCIYGQPLNEPAC